MAAVGYSESIDLSLARSSKVPNPAYYTAHAIRRKVDTSDLHIGTAPDSHLLFLAAPDEPTLATAVEAARAVLERLTRPAAPKVKRVRLALSQVGFLHCDKLRDILSDQLGRVVHLVMHGSRALPQYGNHAAATVLVPEGAAIPLELKYTHEGATLLFSCRLHKDQRSPRHRASQDVKAPVKIITTTAGRKRADAAAASAANAGPTVGAAAVRDAAVYAAVNADAAASANVNSDQVAASPVSPASAALDSAVSPASVTFRGASPERVAATTRATVLVGVLAADPSLATQPAGAPEKTAREVIAQPAADQGAVTSKPAVFVTTHADDFHTVSRRKRHRSSRHRDSSTDPGPSLTDLASSPSSLHNRFKGLEQQEEDDPIDYDGVEGGEEVPVSPCSPPVGSPAPKRLNAHPSSPTDPAKRSPRDPKTPLRTGEFGAPCISSPPQRGDWVSPRR